jgi:hypothetical protein
LAPKRPADRIAAERAAAAQQAKADARQAEADERREKILSLGHRAEPLIPAVLERLAADDYPGIEDVEAYVPRDGLLRFVGKVRLTRAGAYKVFEYSYLESHARPAGRGWVRLLSDGHLVVGRDAYSVPQFVAEVIDREGLGPQGTYATFEPFSLAGLTKLVDALSRLAAGPSTTSAPPERRPATPRTDLEQASRELVRARRLPAIPRRPRTPAPPAT